MAIDSRRKVRRNDSSTCFVMRTPILLVIVAIAAVSTTLAGEFAVGADISSVTKLESRGYSFADANGKTGDVFRLMKDLGLTAVRLRVWVDPSEKFCGKGDTVRKAKRAADCGLDVMVDFHYSDSWADPGKQPIPKAWSGKSAEEVNELLGKHTRDVLSAIKSEGVDVKWVQIGNEVAGGMLWTPKYDDEGKAHWEEVRPGEWSAIMVESLGNNVRNPDNFAMFFKTGAAAAKSVFPQVKTIVHFPNAHDNKAIADNLNILMSRGAKWDIVGVSLYTHHERDNDIRNDAAKIQEFDKALIGKSLRSIRIIAEESKTPVMIVETGFELNPVAPLTVDYSAMLMDSVARSAKTRLADVCLGVFYWEPTSLVEEYPLGAFEVRNTIFRPTSIMDALVGKWSPNKGRLNP